MDEERPAAAGGHVVLCGLNELGYRTLEELFRMGEEIVVVARAPTKELADRARGLGATLIEGSYRDESVLRSAGVPDAAALIVVEDDDVGNLHAALTAHDLNSDLRIRLRMFNQQLGRRVERLFHDCRVFDAAALAVPAFVSAALHHDWRQPLEVGGRRLVVRQGSAADADVVLPLARIRDDGTADLFPSDGDDLLCLAEAPQSPAGRTARDRGPRSRLRRPSGLASARAVLASTDRRLRSMAVVLAALVLLSVVIFKLFAGLDVLDAVYFTVTIITTTGFGDIHLRDAPAALQIYGVSLMLFGAAALAILFALVTDVLVSARLAGVLGGLPRQLRGHVIVCGVGNIGYRVVEHLVGLDVPVVAVEQQETNRFLPAVRRLGVPVLIADIRLTETLQALHVGQARSLVVVTSSDVVNLETALNANELNPDLRVVLRLFDPDLAARVERAFGIHISRSHSALAAPAFAAAAEGERVIATISVGIPVLLVARVQVDAGSKAEGGTIADLESATRSRTLLLTGDDRPSWCPPGHVVLRAGHELVMVVTRGGLAQVLASTQVDLAKAARNQDQEGS